jgi:hypothetical protein
MPMTDPEPTISLAEIREELQARGVSFSDSRLKRLRREGLLPLAEQIHRSGLHGSESRYPVWAIGQLQLVDRLARGTSVGSCTYGCSCAGTVAG